MILFPAIDIFNGDCVRLKLGEFSEVTVYGSPLEMAKKWESQGAQYLHIVDLNGAKKGLEGNLSIVKEIVQNVNIPLQLGGGIRSLEDIRIRLEDVGVSRVILGTACLTNPSLVADAVRIYGAEKIVCGVDSKNGLVAINGWVESVDMTPIELCLEMKKVGVKYVVFTDISRDGMLSGVNAEASKTLCELSGMSIIASGGVGSLRDVLCFKGSAMYGIIFGKALYEGKFSVKEAIDALK